ncbi:MAG: DUF4920 domain-containing protein [Chitinophagales bacterium]|jgi:hypothetical protein|nr:DUF4920 domain-containing protein [Chitinophagales bacterium]
MNKTLIASLLFGTCVTLASCDNNTASNNESATANEVASKSYGVAFEDKGAITPDSMDAYVRSGKEFNGVVTGTIENVCQAAGCWADFKLKNGNLVKVMFRTAEGDEITIPKDAMGKTMTVNGVGFTDTISIEKQKHLAKDNNASAEEIAAIKEVKIKTGFTASGVIVK